VVPRWAKTRLFRPISTLYTGQIRARDVARTTFHTVSEGVFSEVRDVRGRYGSAGLAPAIPSTAGAPTPTSEAILPAATTSTAEGVPLTPKA
jgi:hypothetical protein